jgi:hypothetical protein
MAVSVYDGTYRSHTLTRQVTGGSIDPVTDLWVEGAPVTETFRVWFEASASPAVVAQVGADTSSVAVKGGLLEPTVPPVTARSGAEYDLTVDGRPQKLTVVWQPPSSVPEEDEIEGRFFVGRLVDG